MTASTSRCARACALSMLYLAMIWVTTSSLFFECAKLRLRELTPLGADIFKKDLLRLSGIDGASRLAIGLIQGPGSVILSR
jgi:hypothetical protein